MSATTELARTCHCPIRGLDYGVQSLQIVHIFGLHSLSGLLSVQQYMLLYSVCKVEHDCSRTSHPRDTGGPKDNTLLTLTAAQLSYKGKLPEPVRRQSPFKPPL